MATTTPVKSIWTPIVLSIIITETAESFSTGGLQAIFILYLKSSLQFEETTAISIIAFGLSFACTTPIVGAYLADTRWGRYNTILRLGMIYALGMLALTVSAYGTNLAWRRIWTFLGVFLVSIGCGGIKPCVSAFGADQIALMEEEEEDDDHDDHDDTGNKDDTEGVEERVRRFFSYFYFCTNVGYFVSLMIVPIIRVHYGFGVVFFFSTVFMVVSFFIFLSRRHEYVKRKPNREEAGSLYATLRLSFQMLRTRMRTNATQPHSRPLPTTETDCDVNAVSKDCCAPHGKSETFTVATTTAHWTNDQVQDANQFLQLLPVLSLFPIFWTLYDQQSSVWILQANRMDLHGFEPEQINVVNPFEIFLLIPLFDKCVYPAMETYGWNVSPIRRMGWGMVLAALSFFVSGILETVIQAQDSSGGDVKVSIFWQIPQITIMAVGEILLSVTAYEWAYSVSPERMKTIIMSIYMLTTAVGDLFGGLLYASVFRFLTQAAALHTCGILMILNYFVYCTISSHQQVEEASTEDDDDEIELTEACKA